MYINDIKWNDQLDKDMLIVLPWASGWPREGHTSVSWGQGLGQGGMLGSCWDLGGRAGPEQHPLTGRGARVAAFGQPAARGDAAGTEAAPGSPASVSTTSVPARSPAPRQFSLIRCLGGDMVWCARFGTWVAWRFHSVVFPIDRLFPSTCAWGKEMEFAAAFNVLCR